MEIESLKQEFRRSFGVEAQIFRAPGRVNLIGEHTDYNEGFVMPAAIDFYTWAAVAPRCDSKLNIRSTSFDDAISLDLHSALRPQHSWSDYVVGVVDQLARAEKKTSGVDVLIHGEVPMGSGLSSSAAIEVATGFALLTVMDYDIDRKALALLCQRSENDFVGTRCGIMDQFVSCNGAADHALLLDCRSLDFRLLPLTGAVRMVVCNTMVKHQHASGEYNQRRSACEEGVGILQSANPDIRSLRDVSLQELENNRDRLPEIIYRRCRHVVTENDRVQRAAAMLEGSDLAGFGRMMAESHRSLRADYEVSCRELDIMVEIASTLPGICGARMTGGGFGGCTINLVATAQAETFREQIGEAYKKATGLTPEIYISSAADGAARVA